MPLPTATPVLIGQNQFTEQPATRRTDLGRTKLIRTWWGPQALLAAKRAEIAALVPEPESIEDTDGVPSTITASFPLDDAGGGGMDPVDYAMQHAIWELIPMVLEKPLATHGFYQMTLASRAAIEKADQEIRKGTARAEVDWDAAYPGLHIQSYVNHRLRGIDTWTCHSYIIRRTITIVSSTALKIELLESHIPETVISWAAMDVPLDKQFGQPAVWLYKPLGGGWGNVPIDKWLVKAPQLSWEKGKKVYNWVQEYWGAVHWSQDLYSGGDYVP